jgi:fructokinase
MFDIVALGESLIDFTPEGKNGLGMQLFARNPGGAPANVLAMAAKLGASAAFIGMVGDDDFGHFLRLYMSQAGIDVSGLKMTAEVRTTLAFVQLSAEGDRSFTFYRRPGADICLRPEDADDRLLSGCGIFHFGSVSLTDEPCRSATLESARRAKECGAVISFDPNYRPPLWGGIEAARREILGALPLADIIKVSGEELELVTGQSDPAAGSQALMKYGARLVLVTLGEGGAYYRSPRAAGHVPAPQVDAVDTTGAGDAFTGALLYRLRGLGTEGIAALSAAQLEGCVRFACAAGSLTTLGHGAIPAMPGREKIDACLREKKNG